jgi:hypothetical protein
MKITVTVIDAVMRGVPFNKYRDRLWNAITELYHPAEVQIVHGDSLTVTIEDDADGRGDRDAIIDLATDITHPDYADAHA